MSHGDGQGREGNDAIIPELLPNPQQPLTFPQCPLPAAHERVRPRGRAQGQHVPAKTRASLQDVQYLVSQREDLVVVALPEPAPLLYAQRRSGVIRVSARREEPHSFLTRLNGFAVVAQRIFTPAETRVERRNDPRVPHFERGRAMTFQEVVILAELKKHEHHDLLIHD